MEPKENGKKTEYKTDEKGRFVEGTPPGPGRPSGSLSLATLLKQRLEKLGPDRKRSIAEHFLDNVLQDAMDGDATSRKLVFNYVEGLPKQSLEVEGGALPLLVKIIKDAGDEGKDS